MKISRYFSQFFHNSQSSGIVLLVCVFISLLLANSSLGTLFQSLLDTELGNESLHLKYPVSIWINDGLMAIFFLLVGLEIKRELVEGELSNLKNASLPIFAAIGGMVIPAVIYMFFTQNTEYSNGWGIPMATDIAFSLAIISMLGNKVPAAVKIFLTALAIVDDLGAILVIALFYSEKLETSYLFISLGIFILLLLLNFFKVKKHIFYIIPGIFLWYFMHHSGIHATIAGVLLAFTIPCNTSETEISPLEKLEEKLHLPVNFLIMPIFALANTNISFHKGMVDHLASPFSLGIILGLFAGKVMGINLFSFIAIKLNISQLPDKSTWTHLIGAGLLAGIGFTMSIFIAVICFKDPIIQDEAKFAILIASIVSGFAGYSLLNALAKRKRNS
ncbi:Na+/H+ antiporter NhaA [Amniculibacterium sp. G2-70]|uniref:Na+/H+ antiporter NhaA n=1 Tax=Amniculibacterium sp. G2-70 TaxID=2767188 RepID=UPI001654A2A1|nr:Na+/H+ antiporter NhaA [Amniculibacterium sp. G2-70]